jgi:hypothetical protein
MLVFKHLFTFFKTSRSIAHCNTCLVQKLTAWDNLKDIFCMFVTIDTNVIEKD